jgi:hypothetical protein
VTPEETAALQEKAIQEHHRVLVRLSELLAANSWTKIEEIPAAVDLWATDPAATSRVIFEVKTLSGSNELDQCRAALSQLLEYKFFHGTESDRLCVALDGPIADRRRALLENLGVAILILDDAGEVMPIGQLAQEWFGRKPFDPIKSQ